MHVSGHERVHPLSTSGIKHTVYLLYTTVYELLSNGIEGEMTKNDKL